MEILRKTTVEQTAVIETLQAENGSLMKTTSELETSISQLRIELEAKENTISQTEDSESVRTSYTQLVEGVETLLACLFSESGIVFQGSLCDQLMRHFRHVVNINMDQKREIIKLNDTISELKTTIDSRDRMRFNCNDDQKQNDRRRHDKLTKSRHINYNSRGNYYPN